jgi:hypothetical protein
MAHNYLDLTPLGRDEDELSWPMEWVVTMTSTCRDPVRQRERYGRTTASGIG